MTKEEQEFIDSYYVHKYLLSIMFDTETENYLRTPKVFKAKTLKKLKLIIEDLTKGSYISYEIKRNLYTFIANIGEIKDCEDYSERFQVLGEITSLLNLQVDDNSLIFYRYNMFARTNDLKYLFKYSNIEIKALTDYVNQLIYNDFAVIKSHLEGTDKEFDEDYLSEFQDTESYYENINLILKECPILLKNKTFYNRVMKVLNANSKNKELQRINNKTLKKVNRNIRKIKL